MKRKHSGPIKFKDETKIHPGLTEYFGYCLTKAAVWFRTLQDEALKNHELQTFHLGILKVLEIAGAKSQIDLGDEMGIDKASMVKLIDHLEKKNLVQRKGHLTDRRVKNVVLTKQGLSLIRSCLAAREEVEKQFFKNLSSADQKNFRRLVSQVLPGIKPSKTSKNS